MSVATEEHLSSLERLLSGLRQSFLDELPEKFDDIERLIFQLDKTALFSSALVDLYRRLHHLHGTSSTYGLVALSNISHQFEDALHVLEHNFSNVNSAFLDICLRYLDLLRSSTARLEQGIDLAQLDHTLAQIRERLFPATLHGLYVDASRLSARVCTAALDGTRFKVSVVHDGFQALERLLQEKFSFLITSKELPRLNGIALMSALRASETVNARIPSILLTSKEHMEEALPQGLFAGVIKKDQRAGAALLSTLTEIFQPRKSN